MQDGINYQLGKKGNADLEKQIELKSRADLTPKQQKEADRKIKYLVKNQQHVQEMLDRREELLSMDPEERRLEEIKITQGHLKRIGESWNSMPRRGKRKYTPERKKYTSRIKKRLKAIDNLTR